MKPLAGAALVLAVLAALAFGAAYLLLPRMIAGDAARTRIESASQAALGRALRYQRLDFGLLPLSLVVVEPTIAGAAPDAPPLLDARRVSLRVALLPLLTGQVLVDGLSVDGATLRLRRTDAGLELPRRPESEGAKSAARDTTAQEEPPPLAVRRLGLRRSTLILEDLTARPPVTWELRDLRAKLRGDSTQEPLAIDASFALASGGRVEAKGTLTLAGVLDLALALEDVALAPIASYLEADAPRIAGNVSGTLAVEGPYRSPDRIVAQLAFRDADLRLGEIALRGPLRLEADLTGIAGAPNGRFDIDGTDAELVYGGAFRKPAGTPATVSGRIVSGPDGALGFDDLELKVRDLDATAKLGKGPRLPMEVRATPFDLTGWEELLPALAGWRLGGRVSPGELTLRQSPGELHGRLDLAGVRAESPHGGVLELRGALVGEGARVRSEGLSLVAAEQPFEIAVEIADLGAPAPRWQVHLEGQGADVNQLLSGFGSRRDALHGRLALVGDLDFPAGVGGVLLASLAGRVRIEIRDGWTSGRSLLKTSLDALLAVAQPLKLVTRGFKTGGLDGDRFESVTGTFALAEGLARTEDLRIVEREHSIELAGTLRLADLALDMKGRLSLAGEDAQGPGRERGIPVAHVGGTLGDPDVEITADAARSFAAALEPSRLGRKLDRALGSEAAKDLADRLGGVLERAAPKRR